MKDIKLATLVEAEDILKRDFHPPDQVNDIYNCDLGEKSSWILPFTINQLKRHAGECILFPGCDQDKNGKLMDVLWFRDHFPVGAKPGFARQEISSGFDQKFSGEQVCQRNCWYLLHKQIPDDRNENKKIINWHPSRRTMEVKIKLKTLTSNQLLPSVIVCFFGMFLHYLTTKETMFAYDYILCDNVGAKGNRARIGYFDRFGHHQCYFSFSHFPEVTQLLGIAPLVKPFFAEK